MYKNVWYNVKKLDDIGEDDDCSKKCLCFFSIWDKSKEIVKHLQYDVIQCQVVTPS